MNSEFIINKNINDQGLTIEKISFLNNGRCGVIFNDNSFSFLSNFIHYRKTKSNKIIIYLGIKKLLTIDSKKNVSINNMTSNIELSFFKSLFKYGKNTKLYNFFSTGDRKFIDNNLLKKLFEKNFSKKYVDLLFLNSFSWKKQVTNSDLHTHLQEILNSYEYIDFIVYVLKKYNISEEIIKKYKSIDVNSIRLEPDKVGMRFEDLERALYNRNNIFTEIKNIIGLKDFKELYSLLYRYIIDNKFKKEGIEYSEISFSTPSTLEYISDNIDFSNHHFLLSINRNSKSIFPHIEKDGKKKVNSIVKTLENCLDKGLVIGFDIMGKESTINKDSFDELFSILVPIIMNHPSSVVRCHAGESNDDDNILNTLRQIKNARENYIQFISSQTGKEIDEIRKVFDSEPRVRIGHGIHFDKSHFDEMCSLMKELNVVVEINITSNLKLGYRNNVSEINKIVNLYKENGIPFVLSTDGGGMYSTSINQEENLLFSLDQSDDYPPYLKDSEEKSKFKFKKGIGNELKDIGDKYISARVKELLGRDYVPSSYKEALAIEEKFYGTSDVSVQVLNEISRLLKFLLEQDIDETYERVVDEINDIKMINKYNPKEAKVKLYFLEKETDIIEGFNTLKYFDYIYENSFNDELNFMNEFNDQYIDEELFKNYIDNVKGKEYRGR